MHQERTADGPHGSPLRPENAAGDQSGALTRAQFLSGAGGIVGLAAIAGATYGLDRLKGDGSLHAPGTPTEVLRFHSRPDLRPPGVSISGRDDSSGYLLLSPSIKAGANVSAQPGALIVDGAGSPVYFRPYPGGTVTNLKVTAYQDQQVLSLWQGHVNSTGYGEGEGLILDAAYRKIVTIRAGLGRRADLHELLLTPEGTALITCFPRTVEADLRSIGGPSRGQVLESIFQEIELSSGRVLMEWRSLERIPVSATYAAYREPFDYLHLNSIDITPDGHLLISARHTWAIYKLHRHTGEVIWTLGGKRSDFELGRGAMFSWQHDARQRSGDTITLFDDGSNGPVKTEHQSRGLVLDVDESSRRANLRHAYVHPGSPLLAAAMGSVQTLPNGNVFVDWGTAPYATELRPDGMAVVDARIPNGMFSYRGARFVWHGQPRDSPAIAVDHERHLAFVSWNGATEVAHWQLHGGDSARNLQPRLLVARHGFETAMAMPTADRYVRAIALDGHGSGLAASPVVRA